MVSHERDIRSVHLQLLTHKFTALSHQQLTVPVLVPKSNLELAVVVRPEMFWNKKQVPIGKQERLGSFAGSNYLGQFPRYFSW